MPKEEYPFKIVDSKAQVGKYIHYRLKEEKQAGKVTYLLTVENVKQEKGRYYDRIELKTDSRYKQKITINVYGSISEPKPKKTN